MAALKRTAKGHWQGDLRSGNGRLSSHSGVLSDIPFSFATRFENAPGTNPEELIAAAHAGCYSMAFANYLAQHGHQPEEISTEATITLDGEKSAITEMHLATTGRVPGLDNAQFQRMAQEAEQHCPVSNLLRHGLKISLEAKLRG